MKDVKIDPKKKEEIINKLKEMELNEIGESTDVEAVANYVMAMSDYSTEFFARAIIYLTGEEEFQANGPKPEVLETVIGMLITGVGEKVGVQVATGELPAEALEVFEDEGGGETTH